MERWQRKVAVVTGASAGIGAAIVENLVDAGLKVVGLARRQDRLDELAKKLSGRKGQFYSQVVDISKEDDILRAFGWIKTNVGPVSILVNNAGVIRDAKLVDGKTQFWREVIDTNVMGLCIATREAVQDMKANKIDGHIIHINSIGGHMVCSVSTSVYPASKYAVTALTETLRYELVAMKSKIKVTSISPGLVGTEIFHASAKVSGGAGLDFSEGDNYLELGPSLRPKDVADAVSYVLGTPPHVQIHELMIKPVGEIY